MKIIKKLILGSAIIGGMTVGNAIQSFAALPPLPVTYFNYYGVGLQKAIADGTKLTSNTSKIRVTLLNGTTPIGTPQVFTFYSDADYAAAGNPLPDRFYVNAYGLLYFRFDMPSTVEIGKITSNYKLKVEEATDGTNYINTGNIGVRDLLKKYYEAGDGFESIATATSEAAQQEAGIVATPTPAEGDIQYGFSGGYAKLNSGAASEGGILGIKEVSVTTGGTTTNNYYPEWKQDVTLGNTTTDGKLTVSDGTTTNQVVIAGENGTVTATGKVSAGSLKVGTSATAGQVLTADENGNATWGSASLGSLPTGDAGTVLVGNGTSTAPAYASNVTLGEYNSTTHTITADGGLKVYSSDGDYGVYGESGFIGVAGSSTSSVGVYGQSDSSAGVVGQSTSGIGVYGQSPNATGVTGFSHNGTGVVAQTFTGTALKVVGKTIFVSTQNNGATPSVPYLVNIAQPSNTANIDLTLPTQSGQILAATNPATTDAGKVLTVSTSGEPSWDFALPKGDSGTVLIGKGTNANPEYSTVIELGRYSNNGSLQVYGTGVYGSSNTGVGVQGTGKTGVSGFSDSGIGVQAQSTSGTALKVVGKTIFASTQYNGAIPSVPYLVNIAKPSNTANIDLTLPTQSGKLVAATNPATTDAGKVLTVSSTGEPAWAAATPTTYGMITSVTNLNTNAATGVVNSINILGTTVATFTMPTTAAVGNLIYVVNNSGAAIDVNGASLATGAVGVYVCTVANTSWVKIN